MFTPIGFYKAVAEANGIITQNLALYLDFKDGQSYDGTGVDVTDLSTNAFTLTGRNYNGGTISDSTLSYQNNLYIDLGDGGTVSNSDFIELSNNTAILPESEDYTMQHWLNLDAAWVYDQSKTEFISCIFEGTELVFTAIRDFQSVGYPEIRWVVRDTNGNISSNNIKLDDYVTNNEWFLFTGTIDRTNNEQKVYINDTLVATGTTTFTGTISPNTDYAFGARPDTTAANDVGLYHGFVGKNMIYKGKALTAAEVATNYNNTKDEFSPPTEIFSDAKYWWRADSNVEQSGGTVTKWTDVINGYELSGVIGDPTLTKEAALNGVAVIDFDGNDALYATSTPASRTGDFTILAVYHADTLSANEMIFGVSRRSGELLSQFQHTYFTSTYGLSLFSRKFGASGADLITLEEPASTGVHAFKGRYDSSEGDVFAALDTLTETAGGTTGNTSQDWDSEVTFAAGAWVDGTSGGVDNGRYFDGKIAEMVMVYGTPSDAEMLAWKTYVNNRYGQIIDPTFEVITDNLEQWLDVVGAGGTESSALADSSGNSRNATNSGISWDGTNSWWYVTGNSDWTNRLDSNYRLPSLTGNTDFTFESWINLTSTNDNNYVGFIHNRSGAYNNNFLEIAIGGNPQGDVNFALIDSSGNEAAANSPSLYLNQWIMVSLVNDGSTNTMTMFVNGVSVDTGDSSNIVSVSRNENYSLYGNFLKSGRNFTTAKFGSYRLYTAAHTATECLNNFNAEKAHFGL